jgi:hypothetical protein
VDLKYFSLTDDKDTLKKKWKKLAIQYHPDKNRNDEAGATEKMQEINSELEYCIKFGGGFSIEKYDIKNPNDLSELIKILLFEMIDDALKEESNKYVLQLYAMARDIISNGVKPCPIIRVVRDDETTNNI